MKFKKELAIAILVLISAQMFPTDGISISVGGDAGGFEEVIQANINDQFHGSTILTADSLSDTITGTGSIKKRFFSNPSSIGFAEVGFDIKNARSYSYDHYVDPDYPSVSDTLDVSNADKITAYASAYNSRGDSGYASTTVSGTRNGASLHGYSSSANAWQDLNVPVKLTKVSQGFESASGDIIQTNEWAKDAEGDAASSRLSVIKGSLEGYVGGTFAAMDLHYDYDPERPYEWDQALVTHIFKCPSAAKIQTEENARNAEGYTASSGIEIKSGSVDSYKGISSSGLTHAYGDIPSGKFAYATAYNDIYGLSGAKIQANEKATDIMGDIAISQTDIAKGSMDSYRGCANASFIEKYYLSPETRYASISHSINGLTGIEAKIDEKAFDTKGIFTSTSTSLRQGSIGSYSGNAAASLDQWVDPRESAFARSYSQEISGKRLDLGALAINSKGIMKHNSTKLKNPADINFENRAEVNLGIPSIYQGQM